MLMNKTNGEPFNIEDFTIRTLRKKDQKRVSKIFFNLIDKIDDKSIQDIIKNSGSDPKADISDEEKNANIIRVFIELFKKAAQHLGKEVNDFLADLIDVTPEDYEELPIDIDVKVLEKLVKATEIHNFFTGALRLFSGTGFFEKQLSVLKSRLGSALDSMQNK